MRNRARSSRKHSYNLPCHLEHNQNITSRQLFLHAHGRARCAHKLLEGTLIKNLIEVRPLVDYPTLNKEYSTNLTLVFYLLRRKRLRSLQG